MRLPLLLLLSLRPSLFSLSLDLLPHPCLRVRARVCVCVQVRARGVRGSAVVAHEQVRITLHLDRAPQQASLDQRVRVLIMC